MDPWSVNDGYSDQLRFHTPAEADSEKEVGMVFGISWDLSKRESIIVSVSYKMSHPNHHVYVIEDDDRNAILTNRDSLFTNGI